MLAMAINLLWQGAQLYLADFLSSPLPLLLTLFDLLALLWLFSSIRLRACFVPQQYPE